MHPGCWRNKSEIERDLRAATEGGSRAENFSTVVVVVCVFLSLSSRERENSASRHTAAAVVPLSSRLVYPFSSKTRYVFMGADDRA